MLHVNKYQRYRDIPGCSCVSGPCDCGRALAQREFARVRLHGPKRKGDVPVIENSDVPSRLQGLGHPALDQKIGKVTALHDDGTCTIQMLPPPIFGSAHTYFKPLPHMSVEWDGAHLPWWIRARAALSSWTPSHWVVTMVVCALTAAVLWLTGCSRDARASAAGVPSGCYALALAKADARAASLCPDHWTTCPERVGIMTQLDVELEACDQ